MPKKLVNIIFNILFTFSLNKLNNNEIIIINGIQNNNTDNVDKEKIFPTTNILNTISKKRLETLIKEKKKLYYITDKRKNNDKKL